MVFKKSLNRKKTTDILIRLNLVFRTKVCRTTQKTELFGLGRGLLICKFRAKSLKLVPKAFVITPYHELGL